MPWRQLSLALSGEHCEAAEDLLLEMGALALTLEDDGDQPLLEPGPGETPLWQQVHLHSLFVAEADLSPVTDALVAAGYVTDHTQVQVKTIADQVWERVWMDRYEPINCGQRLWIYPREWPQAVPSDRLVVRLDPGLAFGSGTHPTTALCLRWIDGAQLDGAQVVDYGCGSGILAIAAALCGAEKVWCVDHDPQALIATRENAEANGVADRVITCHPEALPAACADFVLANILAGVLTELSEPLLALMKPQAQLVMSGMLREQVPGVQAHYQQSPAGRDLIWQCETLEDWARLVARR